MESAQAAVAAPNPVAPSAIAIRPDWLYKSLAKLDASGNQVAADATDHSIVYDPITGLMEAVNAPGFDRDFTHDEAVSAVAALSHAGYRDWALPNVPEAVHSVDYSREEPAADTSLYPDAKQAWYWTGQQTAWTLNEAGSSRSFFYVHMYYGNVYNYGAFNRLRVRPVRRGVPASQCLALGQS